MKKIKFRVWDKIDKKMLMVRALQFDKVNKDNKLITILADDGSDNPTKSFTNKKYSYVSNDIVTTPFENCSAVMQFTGLKDKNGKEIYEGDIIFCDGLKYEVFWDATNCCWSAETDEKEKANELEVDGEFQLKEDECDCFEIIGNKFENLELLK